MPQSEDLAAIGDRFVARREGGVRGDCAGDEVVGERISISESLAEPLSCFGFVIGRFAHDGKRNHAFFVEAEAETIPGGVGVVRQRPIAKIDDVDAAAVLAPNDATGIVSLFQVLRGEVHIHDVPIRELGVPVASRVEIGIVPGIISIDDKVIAFKASVGLWFLFPGGGDVVFIERQVA